MKKPTHVVYREHVQRMRKRERNKLTKITIELEAEIALWLSVQCQHERCRRSTWIKRAVIAALEASRSNTTCTDVGSVIKRET
jgi:hypothetical protein